MTEYEGRVVAALESIAATLEGRAAAEAAATAATVEAIRMREAVEGVAVEVDAARPAADRVDAVRQIAHGALGQ